MGTSQAKIVLKDANYHVLVSSSDMWGNKSFQTLRKVDEERIFPIQYNFTVRVMHTASNVETARREVSSWSTDIHLEVGDSIRDVPLIGPIR